DVGTEVLPRHGAKTTSGQRHYPDMARKRCRDRGITPTWRENDVGTEAFSRHGAKTTAGQRRFRNIARAGCRERGIASTWRKNDVGTEALPRHGAKTMSGQRHYPDMAQKRRRDRGKAPLHKHIKRTLSHNEPAFFIRVTLFIRRGRLCRVSLSDCRVSVKLLPGFLL